MYSQGSNNGARTLETLKADLFDDHLSFLSLLLISVAIISPVLVELLILEHCSFLLAVCLSSSLSFQMLSFQIHLLFLASLIIGLLQVD